MLQDKIDKANNNSHYGSFAVADMGPKHVDVHYTDTTRIFKATTKDGSASTIAFNDITVILDKDATARFDNVVERWFGDAVVLKSDILARIIEAGLRELCDYPMYAEEE